MPTTAARPRRLLTGQPTAGRFHIQKGIGDYYQTPDAAALETIYREIAGVIPWPPEAFWGRR